MKTKAIDAKGGEISSVQIHHSNDVCAAVQYGFWRDGDVCVEIVPSKAFCLVCVTTGSDGSPGSGDIIDAWLVFSPVGLCVSFPVSVKKSFYSHSSIEMQEWYKACGGWKHVKHGNS